MILNTLEKSVSNETQRKIDAEAALRVVEENRAKAKENEIASNLTTLGTRVTTAESDINTVKGRVTNAESDIDSLEGRMNTAESNISTVAGRMDTAESDINSLKDRMDTAESDIDTVEGRLDTIDEIGTLASQDFVNSSINNIAAYFITKRVEHPGENPKYTYEPFDNYYEFTHASTYYSGGVEREPTHNDYTVILADESHKNLETNECPTTRYIFIKPEGEVGTWQFQYIVNNSGFTAAQFDALNSGLTAAGLSAMLDRLSAVEGAIPSGAGANNKLALASAVSDEATRATAAENVLRNNLAAEITDRTNADAEINAKIDAKITGRTVSLPVANWSNKTQTVAVTGVKADETSQFISVRPLAASKSVYEAAEVRAVSAAADSLTFECDTVPTADVEVYVIIQEVTPIIEQNNGSSEDIEWSVDGDTLNISYPEGTARVNVYDNGDLIWSQEVE